MPPGKQSDRSEFQTEHSEKPPAASDDSGGKSSIAVAHSECFADFSQTGAIDEAVVAMRFVDQRGTATETYSLNPNGSARGITSVTTPDGRFTVLMPYAERVVRTALHSWHPDGWGEDSPWMRMFRNARVWVD